MTMCGEMVIRPRLPRNGDVVFKRAQSSSGGLGTDVLPSRRSKEYPHTIERWYSYERGYKLAADMLLRKALEECPSRSLLFPIVFLYRHHLELSLKSSLLAAARLKLGVAPDSSTHDLLSLWEQVKRVLPAVWPGLDAGRAHACEACLREISDVDRRSSSFRYPFDKKGEQNLYGIESVDLGNFREVIEGVSNFLDCVGEAVGQQLDHHDGLDCL